MGINNKNMLFERMQFLNPSHKFILSENKNKDTYKSILLENNVIFNEMVNTFIEYGKLTGVINEDRKYLTKLVHLFESEEDFDPYAHLKSTEKINEKDDCLLSISPNNGKLDHPYFSLPAGYTCPFASACKTKVPRNRNKIDGKLVQDMGDIRCYAASEEARYPSAQNVRWKNKDLLDKFDESGKVELILKSLKYFEQSHGKITLFRIHESGDFYDLEYFDAWLEVARLRPDILFYAYTKSLPFWIKRKTTIPNNFKLE